ncbi:MAG: indole-3-glycerol phosphate synthase TrpC [Thermodesulfobacterium geofontis]|uniref:Indole-3-glycerol phosphate synthase n=1 Tax=Thermodesulfobacterium geofontis TaxID=1295609 RepID=A0A2N7PPV2_9BACT|nr:MAG: indole-3-glycerol phosphate synthase TrpC [Thermodesulfobacterium geofontis]PMP93436.1 MAG: indole-3-glycerol phosphate synthase TrpC [Thermodesulfobacterium geofontis]
MKINKINQILNQILIEKYYEVLKRKKRGLYFKPFWDRTPINFKEYLLKEKFVIIAEIKRKSPLNNEFRENFDPLMLAKTYEKGGAKAISVITEEIFFGGSLEYLASIRTKTNLPLLRKDFIFDPIQIEEAKAFGADIILLISSILSVEELSELNKYAKKLNLSSLVEIHDKEDLEKALKAGAEIIGINNRNLSTLKININQSLKIFPLIPKGIPVIAESGYNNPEEIKKIKALGFKGVLIGTSLVKSSNPERKLKEFLEALNEV